MPEMQFGLKTSGLFHLTAIIDDLDAISVFFDRVFGVPSWQMGFFGSRYARFAQVGDVIFDLMVPDHAYGTPFRQFRLLVGEHWTFPCFHVTDMQDFVYKARKNDEKITTILGEPIFGPLIEDTPGAHIVLTHPWDTGAELELFEFKPLDRAAEYNADPRVAPDWKLPPPPANSIGALRGAHHTLVLDDETKCVKFLTERLGGTILSTGENVDRGTRSTYVAVGDRFRCVMEVAVPIADGPARRDQERNGNIYHCVTFEVEDMDRAARHLEGLGIRMETRSERLIVTDPADCHGLRFGFTPTPAHYG